MKYDAAKQAMISAADFKMNLNDFKGPIETLSVSDSAELAKREIDELVVAALAGDWEHVIIEVGDVLNFLIGITHTAMTNYKERKK